MESVTLDDLDRQLLHALQLDGRASFNRIAGVLGVPERTLARRYSRLRSSGAARVSGLVDSRRIGRPEWFVRMRCLPDGASAVARTLARHPDTSWVTVLSGGSEISCLLRGAEHLRLDGLARSPRVVSVQAHRLLRPFMDEDNCWGARVSALTPEQAEALRPDYPAVGAAVALTELDRKLLPELSVDGRAPFPVLARSVGWSESAVRRRLEHLRRARTVLFSVETDIRLFGFTIECMLWLKVAPGRLTDVGETLSRDIEAAFVAAVTGTANLMAYVVCRDADALYAYLTGRVGAMDGVQDIETVPITGYAKRVGAPVAG
ncbi:Lrp/AsnC family transcriptional regulator [Nonomuraea sp. NPDC049152]|uniref:Lrp/AsnC family transcriptional regulator n=1 Tax=Nonomuraea sp. NPDC049152 TaxID=3154350 RepID=UPI0033E6C1F6